MTNAFIRSLQGQEQLDALHSFPSSHSPRTKSGCGYWHAPVFGLTHRSNGFLALLFCCVILSGCGASYVVKGASGANTGSISPSPNSVDFGTVNVGQSVNTKVEVVNQGSDPVEISQLTLSGTSFSVDGQGTLPVTLAAGSTMSFKVHFNPSTDGTSTGQVTIATDSTSSPTAAVKLHGVGKKSAATPSITVNAFSCTAGSMTGAGTDACTVTLSGAAASGGQSVSLSSGNGAVTVPATVMVPASATTASFNATVSAVTSTQSVTLTASANSSSRNFSLQLNPAAPTTPTAPAVSSLSCSSGTMTSAGTDACSVTLSTAAPSGGTSVTLSSNNGVVSVPSTVAVPANATSAGFSATVSSFSTSQAATLTAAAGGATKSFALQLNAGTPTLSASTSNISFGNVIVGQTAKQSVTLTSAGTSAVTISSISVAGSLFASSGVIAPVTLNPGQKTTLNLQFNPDHLSSFTGTLTIVSNSSKGNVVVNMSGAGIAAPGTLSALTCVSGSMSAAGTDACTVGLAAPAGSSGLTVTLSSNNSLVAVPVSVTVPANATSATFNAAVSAFTADQTVTLSANAGGLTKTFGLQLNAGGTSTLSINTTSLAFGSVVLDTPATQPVTLTSTGTASVTVNSATVSGAGFSVTGATFPLTLNPNQSVTLNIQFDPTTAGAVTGQLTVTSTSSNSTAIVSLSGTGTAHEVDLSWNAPTSSADPVAGYNVYRSSNGGTSYQAMGSVAASQTSYVDNTVASGQGYDYIVKAYDSSHVESGASNMTSVTIP
jgi:hypothetical protein